MRYFFIALMVVACFFSSCGWMPKKDDVNQQLLDLLRGCEIRGQADLDKALQLTVSCDGVPYVLNFKKPLN